jgi:hypothetical protein
MMEVHGLGRGKLGNIALLARDHALKYDKPFSSPLHDNEANDTNVMKKIPK